MLDHLKFILPTLLIALTFSGCYSRVTQAEIEDLDSKIRYGGETLSVPDRIGWWYMGSDDNWHYIVHYFRNKVLSPTEKYYKMNKSELNITEIVFSEDVNKWIELKVATGGLTSHYTGECHE